MDVARAPQKKTGRNAMIGGGVLVLIVVTVVFARLKPASPTVEAATMYMDSVRRGDMVRDVRGPGSLVPEHITWISAQASARVDKLVAESGQKVKTGDILLELSNPDQQIQALNAEQSLSAAEAALVNLTTQLHSGTLSQEGVVATTNTQYVQAKQDAMAADTLLAKKLISPFDYNNKKALADELTQRVRIERERLALMRQTVDSQISVQRQQVKRLRDIAKFQEAILASLSVRSPDTGVLQDLTLQPGQWVTSGTMLAKVVEPGKLKAQLRIPKRRPRTCRSVKSLDRHTQRYHPRTCLKKGPLVGCGDRARGRGARWRAPGRRSAGPQCGRHHRDRAAEERALHRTPGIWRGHGAGGDLQGRGKRQRGDSRTGAAGQKFGQPRRSRARVECG